MNDVSGDSESLGGVFQGRESGLRSGNAEPTPAVPHPLPPLPEPRLITTVRDLAHTKLALYDAEQMRDYAVAYAAAQTAELRQKYVNITREEYASERAIYEQNLYALRAEIDAARAALAEKPVLTDEPVAPIGYIAAYEIDRLRSGHDARVRWVRIGPSLLDGDVPLYAHPPSQPPREPMTAAEAHAFIDEAVLAAQEKQP